MATAVAVATLGLVVLPATVASAAVLPTPAPVEQRSASTVTADVLPTVQIDSGIVWSQVIIKGKVYAGGSFSNARAAGAAPGTSLTPRGNLLAYNLTTGNLDTTFAPSLNGQVKVVAASPDGSRLYVGGSFNQANGQTRFNIAAYDTTTGALITTFKPAAGGSYVNAIAATNTTVYVGGLLAAGAGVARKNLMAFDAATGKLKDWAPVTDLQVDTMVMTPSNSKVIIGGRFSTVNNVSQRGMAALDPTSGALTAWAAPQTIQNGMGTGTTAGKAGIYALSTDGTSIFGTGWVYANVTTGNLEGAFSAEPESGNIQWLEDCHGDAYSAYSDKTNVYAVGHPHDCVTSGGFPQANPAPGNMRHAIAFTAAARGTLSRSPSTGSIYKDWSGQPAPAMINWFPDWVTGTASGQGQAAWTITGSGDYVVFGGEFPYVNGTRQQGLVRFARPNVAPKKQGPRLAGANWVPSLTSIAPGSVRISMPANWDRDDLSLSYKILRDGNATTPAFTKTQSSTFWNLPGSVFTDTNLQPGSTHTYQLVATDPDGNEAKGAVTSVTVTSQSMSPYAQSVINAAPSLFWRLGEASGTAAFDWANANDGMVGSTVTRGATGAVSGDADKASTFSGSTTGIVATTTAVPGPNVFSLQAWFKAPTTSAGGKIIGFGSSASGSSGSYDRQIYMQSDGKIRFGVYNGAARTVVSTASYKDNSWHQVVGTMGDNGLVLYVDGQQVAVDSATKTAQVYNGYWRIGGDNLGSWPSRPTSDYFAGSIDDVSVFPVQLSGAQVANFKSLASGGASAAPTAAFTATPNDLTVAFDAGTSTASSGQSISGWDWNFGDGSARGTTKTASHTYDAAGTYTVTLQVTDSQGITDSVTKSVTVKAAHAKPVAVIGAAPNALAVQFDSSGSTASDGATIASQSWTFGDGGTSTLPNPSHTFTAAGTYNVTLTVTDSQGATSAAATQAVTVSKANPVASFTANATLLDVAVNGSASTAPQGETISGYAWTWGDGTANGSGATASHSYADAGTYSVKLTVTDTAGGTASTTKSVTVLAPGGDIAADAFARTVATGWGTAETGGNWGTSAGFSVTGNSGKLALTAKGQTRTNVLSGVSARDVDATLDVALDKVADGSGTQFSYLVRRTTGGDYHLKLRYAATGSVTVSAAKLVGTTETLLSSATISGLTYTPNQVLKLRFQAVGAGSTALKAKVWKGSDAEPSAWLVSATDSEPTLQTAGSIGVVSYLTSTSTSAPVTVSIDNLKVTAP
ncbi:PKD domain-containing protein [Nakamurella sp. GG22]